MATIDSASTLWSDGAAPGCRNQRAPRIGDIQRHKAMDMDRNSSTSTSTSTSTSSGNSSTSSSANSSVSGATTPTTQTTATTHSDIIITKDNNLITTIMPITNVMLRQPIKNEIQEKEQEQKQQQREQQNKDYELEKLNERTMEQLNINDEINDKNNGAIGITTTTTATIMSGIITGPITTATATTTTTKGTIDTIKIPTTTHHNNTRIVSKTLAKHYQHPLYMCGESTPSIALPSHIKLLPKTQSLDIVDSAIIETDNYLCIDDNNSLLSNNSIGVGGSSGIIIVPLINNNNIKQQKQQQEQQPIISSTSINNQNETTNYKTLLPKLQSLDHQSRPIYPNVPYSPYGSPYGSPRSGRRRAPLRESRRVSIEQSGSFLQLNQYKLMDQIGQGSYGLVKLAYSEEDSTHYAMKILSKRKLLRKAGLMGRGPKRGTSPLDRVYREIAVLKKLDHPNVVKLIEVLDDPLEDSLYLVFELVTEGEVLSIPNDSPLVEERAWSVFRDSLLGLEYLHYQRIIHGDLKPGNLLLGECGRVKIADLGVCNEFMGEDAAMNNGSTAGTPAFRAPETLIPGQHLYSGKAADIWALGATIYSLIYGNVPFVAQSVPGVYEKIKNDLLLFPEQPAIRNDLRDLIEKMLDKDPNKRITLPQIKEHPWVTANGTYPLPSEEENCRLVQISDEDIHSVVKSIPKLDTLILIKTMLKKHSFQNPFSRGVSGRAPQRGGSRLERFSRAGRSNSAPGAYHTTADGRQMSNDNLLPSVTEGVPSSNSDLTCETLLDDETINII